METSREDIVITLWLMRTLLEPAKKKALSNQAVEALVWLQENPAGLTVNQLAGKMNKSASMVKKRLYELLASGDGVRKRPEAGQRSSRAHYIYQARYEE